MAKKTNPRNIPCSMADVERAHTEDMNFGMEFALNITLYVLKDKHDAPSDEVMQLRDEFMYVIDSIAKGYLTYPDIRRTLKGDYDMAVHLTNR